MDKLRHTIQSRIEGFKAEWLNDHDYIMAHTSGSTGTPKHIRLPKEMMRRSARRSISFFGIDTQSRLHLCLQPDYIAGKMLIVRSLEAGCRLTAEEPSAFPLAGDTDGDEIHLLSLVGSQLQGFAANVAARRAPAVKHLLLGGAPLNAAMRATACALPCRCWESYGMTETASHVALRPVTPDGEQCFEALEGITFSLTLDQCLIINMGGDDGTIITNDMATLTDERHFHLLGRKDNVIITGALKLFPQILEEKIAPHLPSDRRFYITSRPSEKWGNEVVLMMEGEPCPLPDFHTLPLLNYERPKAVYFIPQFDQTTSGKIIRHKT